MVNNRYTFPHHLMFLEMLVYLLINDGMGIDCFTILK